MKKTLFITKPFFWSGALVCLSLSASVWAHDEPSVTENPAHEAHEAPHEMVAPSHEDGLPVKGKTYVVRPGDSLDRIIQKTMPNSPLKIEYLRDAMVKANPEAFSRVGSYRIRSGQVLQLPDLGQVLRVALGPLAPSPESQAQTDEQVRRRWVHYP